MLKKYLFMSLIAFSMLRADSLSVYIDLNPEEFMVKGSKHSASEEMLLDLKSNFSVHLKSNGGILPAYKITKSSVSGFNNSKIPENHIGKNSNVIIYSNDNLPMKRGYIYTPEFMKMLSVNMILESLLAIADSNGIVPDDREHLQLYNTLFNKFSKRNFYFTYSRRLSVATDFYKTVLSSVLSNIYKEMLTDKDREKLLSISSNSCIINGLEGCKKKSEAINEFLNGLINSHDSSKFKSYSDLKIHLPDKVKVITDNIVYIYKLVEAADRIVTKLSREFDYSEGSVKYINYILDPKDYFSYFSIYPQDNFATVYIKNSRLRRAKARGYFNFTGISRPRRTYSFWAYLAYVRGYDGWSFYYSYDYYNGYYRRYKCFDKIDPNSGLVQRKGVKLKTYVTYKNGHRIQKIDYIRSGDPYYKTIYYPVLNTYFCWTGGYSPVSNRDVIDLFKYVYNSIYNEVLYKKLNPTEGLKGLRDLYTYNDMLLNIYVTVKDSYITPAIDSLVNKSFTARAGGSVNLSGDWKNFFNPNKKEGDWHQINYIKMFTINENGIKGFPVTFDILGLQVSSGSSTPPEKAKEKPKDRIDSSRSLDKDISDIAKGKLNSSKINRVKNGFVYIVFLNKFKDYTYSAVGKGITIKGGQNTSIGKAIIHTSNSKLKDRLDEIFAENSDKIGLVILCKTNNKGEISKILNYTPVDISSNGGKYLFDKVFSLIDPSVINGSSEETDPYVIDGDRLEEAYTTLINLFMDDIRKNINPVFGRQQAKIIAISRDIMTTYHFGGINETVNYLKKIADYPDKLKKPYKFENYFINPLKITDVKTTVEVLHADYEFDNESCSYKASSYQVRHRCSVTMTRSNSIVDVYTAAEFAKADVSKYRPESDYHTYNVMMYNYGGKNVDLINDYNFYTSSVSVIKPEELGTYSSQSKDDCQSRYHTISSIGDHELFRDKTNSSFDHLTILQNRYVWSNCKILPDPGSDEHSLVYNIIHSCKQKTGINPYEKLYSDIGSIVTEYYLIRNADKDTQFSQNTVYQIEGAPEVPENASCKNKSSSEDKKEESAK